jgi:RimJ/RimL family protein N-acetyltransferase
VERRPRAEGSRDNLRLRSIRPDDWRRLQRFHDRLSPETVQLRFHGAKHHLSEPLSHRFTAVDGEHDAAIVATTGTRGRIVGVARYSTLEPGVAEVAFVVEDRFQHHGLGGRLMRRLMAAARANGIEEFVAEVIPGNVPMLRLLHEAGSVAISSGRGVSTARVRLDSR